MAASSGIRAGAAYVELGTHDKALIRGLAAARARLNAFAAGATRAGIAMTAAAAGPAAAIAGAVRSFATAGSAIYDVSKRTGVSAEALSALKFAADQSGASLEDVAKGLRRMQVNATAAADGSATAAAGFRSLGLNAAELLELNPAAQFATIADALVAIDDPARKTAAAVELFGKSGATLLPMLERGSAGLMDAYKEAARLGLIFSGPAAESADALGDALDVVGSQARRSYQLIGEALAPTVTALANKFATALAAVMEFLRANQWLVKVAAGAVATLAAAGIGSLALGAGLKMLSLGVGGLAGSFKLLGAPLKLAVAVLGAAKIALAALLSPTALIIAAIAAVGTALVLSTDTGRAALASLGNTFGELKETATTTIGGIKDALAAGDLQLAAKVLWAGLRLAWEQGIAPLRALWLDFKHAFTTTATEAFYYVRSAWEQVANWFWKSFPDFTAMIASTWKRLMKWLADAWIEVLGLFDRSIDVDLAKAMNADQLAADLAHIRKKATQTDAEHDADLASNLGRLAAERAEALRKIDDAAADSTTRAAAELEAAKAALAAVTQEAKAAREEAAAKTAGQAVDTAAGGLADALKNATAAAASTLAIAGGFNPNAIEFATGANTANRIARAVEKTAQHTGTMKGTLGDALAFG